MAIKYGSNQSASGTSAERTAATWTGSPVGYRFFETDTGLEYYWNGTAWTRAGGTPNEPYAYYVFKSGSTYYAKAGDTTSILSSNSDAATVIQAAVTAVAAISTGGLILLSATDFQMNAPISIPPTVPINIWGIRSSVRQRGTSLGATTSFPTARYFFESINAPASNVGPNVDIRNINMYNVANFGTKDIGGIRLEDDTFNPSTVNLENIAGQYLYRGIHLQGNIVSATAKNVYMSDINASFVGEFDVKLDSNGHSYPPQECHVSNLRTFHSGTMTNSVYLNAAYTVVHDYVCEGGQYTESAIALKDGWSNIFDMFQTYDTHVAPGVSIILIDATAPYSSTSRTHNNRFINCRAQVVSPAYTVAFRNNAHNNFLQLGFHYSVVSIDDSGSGAGNIIEIYPGDNTPVQADTKITSTNGLVRISDKRKGAENKGVSTQSGNASTTVFNIAHGLFTTPLSYSVVPQTADALGSPVVTATSTNLVLTYGIAPPTGTSNLTWVWSAGVY